MKIAQFSYEYPPRTWGGLGIYLQGLVEFQRKAKDHVDVFFLGEGSPPDGLHSLPFLTDGELVSYTLQEIAERSRGVDYDAVICQDWPGIVASRALWKRGVPLVVTCHLPLAWDIGSFEDVPCPFAKQMEMMSMACADSIIAVSQAVRDELEQSYSFTRGKIRVVHNGSDTTLFSPGAKTDTPTVLFVGRFVEQKGFDLLPEVFASLSQRHPGLRFRIIGTGPLQESVVRRLEERGLAHQTTFYDFSSQDTVLALYREATVVVMPSRFEPFGLVATESMATATPVVASRVSGLAEIITDGEDGFLVSPDDVHGFANAVSRLLTDPRLAQKIGVQARESATRKFSQNRCFAETRAVYADTIERHRSSRAREARGALALKW